MKKHTIVTLSSDLSWFDRLTEEERSALAVTAEKAWRNSALRIQLKDDATEPQHDADVFTAPGGESS